MNLKDKTSVHFRNDLPPDPLDNEIYDLVFQHRLGVGVGDEERNIIALWSISFLNKSDGYVSNAP